MCYLSGIVRSMCSFRVKYIEIVYAVIATIILLGSFSEQTKNKRFQSHTMRNELNERT